MAVIFFFLLLFLDENYICLFSLPLKQTRAYILFHLPPVLARIISMWVLRTTVCIVTRFVAEATDIFLLRI